MWVHRFLSILVLLTWGLWFGGLVTLFLAVTALFTTFGTQRPIAGTGAAEIFRRFELFQLVLAAAALLATLAWRLNSGPSRLKVALLALLSLSTVCAIVETTVLARRMETLRGEGRSQSDEFRSLHGRSMMLYVGETALLLAAGVLLPAAMSRDVERHLVGARDA